MAEQALVETLRQDIERKYREALAALDTLKTYLATAGHEAQAPLPPAQQGNGVPHGQQTRVDRVLHAISTDFKTVKQLEAELGLPDAAIRAVLYSKFVRKRLSDKRIGRKMAFKVKAAAEAQPQRSQGEVTAASLVRDAIAASPSGLTAREINALVGPKVTEIGGTTASIGAALYNMKKRGKVTYDAGTLKYRQRH